MLKLIRFLAVLFFGIIFGAMFEIFHEVSAVLFINQSSKNIKNIEFTHLGNGDFKGNLMVSLKPNEAFKLKWFADGETSFSYVVYFEDGTILKSKGQYSSRGEKINIFISNDGLLHKISYLFGLDAVYFDSAVSSKQQILNLELIDLFGADELTLVSSRIKWAAPN